ncbi:signal peptidase I [Corynebacterium sp. zg254]|uniref:signal peptidase I n=1 Tax=Corynebacterium sp. zg254 TaxID=2656645 RepID=UPI002151933C|nr:signal peptidase I [Corynebacterium sp. zg254]
MTDSQDAKPSTPDKKKKTYPWWVEMPIIIVVTLLVLGAFNTFVGRMYLIPSESMEPTLHGCAGCTPDRIFVNKLAYVGNNKPKPGEVVVFVGEDSWNWNYTTQRSDVAPVRALQNAASYIGIVAPDENTLVKRVIATEGQTVQCLEGDPGIMVDGKKVDDSYIMRPAANPIDTTLGSEACQGNYFGPVTIPPDHLWMMGDNRTNSLDSRGHMGDELQGTISMDHVVGRVEAIILPFDRISRVKSLPVQG